MRNNEEVVAYVDQLRQKQDISMNELARETGLAKSSISRYFNKTRGFPINKVGLFAKALHTTPEDILGIHSSDKPTKIPFFEKIPYDKSVNKLDSDTFIDEYYVPEKDGTLFSIKVADNGMQPKIPKGSVVIASAQNRVEDGDVAVVLFSNSEIPTLKRIKHSNGVPLLFSDNSTNYPPVALTDNNQIKIIGKAIKSISAL